MRTNALVMNFSVDKENKQIKVEREFDAPVSKVWAAWTDSHLLDQWWAPKPWQAKTKTMDFREGGFWLYAMVGPDGTQSWCRADFREIVPQRKFTGLDAFCDENGNLDRTFPVARWHNEFRQQQETTLVDIRITFDEVADLEKYIEMGFKEGFTSALENLDGILTK